MKTQNTSEIFGHCAEVFARFFGTPGFIITQTVIVFGWIVLNCIDSISFDPYPFILLNLAFSTQAAYAAPLILLAQSRQADRDKSWAESDAKHREHISQLLLKRQRSATRADKKIIFLLSNIRKQNMRIIKTNSYLCKNLKKN